jgi:hypothetical protein
MSSVIGEIGMAGSPREPDGYDLARRIEKLKNLEYKRLNTIHKQGILDVEVNINGRVIAVWYNCLALPFRQTTSRASKERETEMDKMYKDFKGSIEGIDFKHEQQ